MVGPQRIEPRCRYSLERRADLTLRDGAGVTVIDEVAGFRYFDARDLLGFVDGTANPNGLDLPGAGFRPTPSASRFAPTQS